MAIRSMNIMLSNGTPQDLTLIGTAGPCQGGWSDGLQAPQTITAQSAATWQTESEGWFRGTEGWVKYEISNKYQAYMKCTQELVYIHWNNPYQWDSHTTPWDWSVTTADVRVPCETGTAPWSNSTGIVNPQACTHELFGITRNAGDPGNFGLTWFEFSGINWMVVLNLTSLGQNDCNLEFAIGLRTVGSVGETMKAIQQVLGPQDIRALTQQFHQPSLRKLFHM